MKFGMRKFSPKKRWAAKVSGKRYIRNKTGFRLPRGVRLFVNPRRYFYDKVYHKVTFDIFRFFLKLLK